MPRRASPTASNTASARRSASRPTSCTPGARSASKASRRRSGSCSATATCATDLALGLFGGTFDPIHFGHLRLATELAEAFRVEQGIFLPAGMPYHRGRAAHATADQRLTMLKLATARDARFGVDDRE